MIRGEFLLPPGIYLDGNSLGPLPKRASERVAQRLLEWQTQGVLGWDGWFHLAESLSPALGRLVGAPPGEVIVTGSITANLHSLLATLYRPRGGRRHLLATALDFPTDLYAMRSWAERMGAELRLIPSRDGHTLAREDILAAFTPEVALALLPTVLYRSGQLLDLPGLTHAARDAGLIIGWDAAHSVGALPHALHDIGADFAVWCHYKYVNGGPGAPGGLYLHRRWHHLAPGLPGWWGHHKASQFEMRPEYRPAAGAAALQQGTPPILALAALEGALELFAGLDLREVRARSLELTAHLMERAERELPELTVVTPRPDSERGGHVSLQHPHARQLSLALRERGVVPDYREPDLLRLAPVALYTTEAELDEVVRLLRELLDSGEHLRRAGVAGAVS